MRSRGFTLLEVMIALLVVALGMGAVLSVTGESAWKSAHLRHSTIASWVAYNEIAMYRAKGTWNNSKQRSFMVGENTSAAKGAQGSGSSSCSRAKFANSS